MATSTKEAREETPGLKVHGNPDEWRLLCKAECPDGTWSKSTKVMEIPGYDSSVNGGVLVQVSTQRFDSVAEAVAFIPGARISDAHGVCITMKPRR